MKNKAKLLALLCFMAASVVANATPSVYINALDLATHGIKNKKLSLHGAVEVPINNRFDFGIQGGHTQASEASKNSLSAAGIYLDYKFLEVEGANVNSWWFIRNYIGISKTNLKEDAMSPGFTLAAAYGFGASTRRSDATNGYDAKNTYKAVGYASASRRPDTINVDNKSTSATNGYDAKNTYKAVGYASTSRRPDTINNEHTTNNITAINTAVSSYRPEFGVYVGRKYIFSNKLCAQIGAGISTTLKHTTGTHYRIKSSDFILDTFIKFGYKI